SGGRAGRHRHVAAVARPPATATVAGVVRGGRDGMNCPDVRGLLQPYSDDELDLVRHVQVEEHLAGCAGCAQQEKNLRSLRAALSAPALRYQAPAALRERFARPAALVSYRRRRLLLRTAAIAAGVLLLIGAVVMVARL